MPPATSRNVSKYTSKLSSCKPAIRQLQNSKSIKKNVTKMQKLQKNYKQVQIPSHKPPKRLTKCLHPSVQTMSTTLQQKCKKTFKRLQKRKPPIWSTPNLRCYKKLLNFLNFIAVSDQRTIRIAFKCIWKLFLQMIF